MSLPRVGDVKDLGWESWWPEPLRYAFRMEGRDYYLWLGPAGQWSGPRENAKGLRYKVKKEVYYAAMTGWHLYNWYRTNRICGCC